jgi:thioredoxin-related protein
MKYIFFALILLLFSGGILASGIWKSRSSGETDELKWNSYSEAISIAKETNKKVLVDVFTTWCGWCKKMDKDVYANAEIKAYLEKNFVLAKLNAESLKQHTLDSATVTEAQISKAFGITGYPTTLFLNNEGKAITLIPGYIKVDVFKNVLIFINEEFYKTTSWDDFLKQKTQTAK